MNPIALTEATGATRTGVLGALATDPVIPSRTADTHVSRPKSELGRLVPFLGGPQRLRRG
jgi:hypothetical protein